MSDLDGISLESARRRAVGSELAAMAWASNPALQTPAHAFPTVAVSGEPVVPAGYDTAGAAGGRSLYERRPRWSREVDRAIVVALAAFAYCAAIAFVVAGAWLWRVTF